MPKTVQVGGRPIKVKITDKIVANDGPGKYMDAAGTSNWKGQLIQIVASHGPDEVADTFVHEAIHMMIASVGLADDILEGKVDEEKIVLRLTPALLNFVRDNPKSIEYITNRRVLGKGSV